MGYNLYITRRRDRFDDEGPSITPEEWAAVVANDPDLEMVGFADAPVDDGVLRYESPGLAQMTSHPYVNEVGAWLDFDSGEVVVKNPDDILVTKMKQIAGQLGANVQGEESELY